MTRPPIISELVWREPADRLPEPGLPALCQLLSDDGEAIILAEICPRDGSWRCLVDSSRLDADAIVLWATVTLPAPII